MTTLNLQVNASTNDAFEDDTGDVSTGALTAICDQTDEYIGLRWTNVTIPNSATINTAVLQVYITSSATDEPIHDIYGEDTDDAAVFVTGSGTESISSRTPTTAVVTWTSADLGSAGGFASAPSVVSIVQEIVNRPGWASGNSIVFVIHGSSGITLTRDLGIDFYDTNSARGAKLDIDYTTGGSTYNETGSGGAVAGTTAVPEITPYISGGAVAGGTGEISIVGEVIFEITSGNNDARQNGSDNVSLTASNFVVNQNGEYVAFRFVNIAIPQGSVIFSAIFQPYITDGTVDEPDVEIWAEDSDDAPALASTDEDLSSRVSTTAIVSWSSTDLGSSGGFASAPDMWTVIQEIIDRPGWDSGNAICIIVGQRSGADVAREFGVDFYDLDPNRAAKLIVNYSDGLIVYTEIGEGGAVAGGKAFTTYDETGLGGVVGNGRAVNHMCESDALVCDKFDDSDDTAIENHISDFPGVAVWIAQSGNWDINATNSVSAESDERTVATIDPGEAEIVLTVDMTMPVSGGNQAAGLVVRYTDDENYIAIFLDNTAKQLQIVKVEDSDETVLLSQSLTNIAPGSTNAVRLETVGDQITFIMGERVASVWDSFNVAETNLGFLSDVELPITTRATFDTLQVVPFVFEEDYEVRGGVLAGGVSTVAVDINAQGGAVSGGAAIVGDTVFIANSGVLGGGVSTVWKFYLFDIEVPVGVYGGGENDVQIDYNYAFLGGTVAGGIADEDLIVSSDEPTGGAVGGETAEPSLVVTEIITASGVLGGGEASNPIYHGITMSGGAVNGGVGEVALVFAANNFESNSIAGGVKGGGTNTTQVTFVPVLTGGVVCGGLATSSLRTVFTPTGGALAGGTVVNIGITEVPSGGALAGGLASSFTVHTVTGGAVAGGIATLSITRPTSISGGAVIGSTATVNSKVTQVLTGAGALAGGYGLPGFWFVGGDRDETVEYLDSITMGGDADVSQFIGDATFNGTGGITISGTSPFVVVFADFAIEPVIDDPIVMSGICVVSAFYFNQRCRINPCTVVDRQSHNKRTTCDAQPRVIEAFDANRRRVFARSNGRSAAVLPGIITCRQKIFQRDFQNLLSIEARTRLKNRSILV